MKTKNMFEIGEVVLDTLGDYQSIVRGIKNDCVLLSRVDKPENHYYQIHRYLKNKV